MSTARPISESNPALLDVRPVEGPEEVDVLEAQGELDLSTTAQLKAPLLERIEGGLRVVLDLSRVSFIDSSGIAVVVQAYRGTTETGNGDGPGLNLVIAPGSQVARVFELAALDRTMPVFTSREEAIGKFAQNGAAG